MRFASYLVVVVLVAVSGSPARAGTRRAGEVSTDVTVRQRPEADAPKIADLSEGEPVIVLEKRAGWLRISGAARGWIPADAFAAATSETEQRRKLLQELAAAKTETEPEGQTDADLMYDAVKQWRGNTPGDATIDRVLANSKNEADKSRRAAREKIKALFWKDPFSDQPHKLIAVRKEDRTLLAARADRRSLQRRKEDAESERLRNELVATRAELAEVRAELRAARAALAHADVLPTRSEPLASRVEASSDDDALSSVHHARRTSRARSQSYESPPQRTERRRSSSRTALASETSRAAAPSVVAEAVPTPAETAPATPPPGWRSSDPRGIIVVPIEAPIPVRADIKKPSRAAH